MNSLRILIGKKAGLSGFYSNLRGLCSTMEPDFICRRRPVVTPTYLDAQWLEQSALLQATCGC